MSQVQVQVMVVQVGRMVVGQVIMVVEVVTTLMAGRHFMSSLTQLLVSELNRHYYPLQQQGTRRF